MRSELELISTVAALGTEDIASQATRMQPHQHRPGRIRLAKEKGGVLIPNRILEQHELCFSLRCDRNGRARDPVDGVHQPPSKSGNGAALNPEQIVRTLE